MPLYLFHREIRLLDDWLQYNTSSLFCHDHIRCPLLRTSLSLHQNAELIAPLLKDTVSPASWPDIASAFLTSSSPFDQVGGMLGHSRMSAISHPTLFGHFAVSALPFRAHDQRRKTGLRRLTNESGPKLGSLTVYSALTIAIDHKEDKVSCTSQCLE